MPTWELVTNLRGPQGPPGASVPPLHQTAPAATWTITHNLGFKPGVQLFTDDDGDQQVYTDVSYPDDNTVVIEWPSPTTGWAYVG